MPIVDLYNEDAPPAGIFLMAHLSPLGAVGQTRIETDPLPFYEVNILDIGVDWNLSIDTALVSVHIYCSAKTPAERAQARVTAADCHRRILLLAHNPLLDVVMPDTTIANCEYLEVVHKPSLKPYGVNTIHRYTGRYRYGLSLVAVS